MQKFQAKVNSGDILIDGLGVGDIGSKVIKDGQQLAEDGIVILAYTINKQLGKVVAGPELSTKGVVYHKDSEDVIKEAMDLLKNKLQTNKNMKEKEWIDLKNNIRDILSRLFYEKLKKKSIILPMFLEI